ncbi:MAG: arginine--tRNA ligase [Candidatus Paceibacterota bacterium]
MVQQNLKKLIEEVLKKLQEQDLPDFEIPEVKVEHPEQDQHGDYATNVALALSDKAEMSPVELAKKIKKEIETSFVEKVEVAEPGFINFFLKDSYFQKQASKILTEGRNFGSKNTAERKEVMVEYGQPNTHKLPHVGHFRSYSLGESLARLLEFNGYDVVRANYQGDVGLHVAKCLWGYQQKGFEDLPAGRQGQEKLEDNIEQLQKAYQYGAQQYEDNEQAQQEIEELNNKIQRKDESIKDLWKKTRQWSIDYYDELQEKLGINYDHLFFESEVSEKAKQIVEDNLGEVFEKSEGAIIFPGSDYDLHDRVFITSDGNPTYEAKDLALAFLKKEDFNYDLSLISTASEQIEYFKVVYKALEQIEPELAEKFVHVPFGLISLKGGELSSRKGNIVSIDELLQQVRESLTSLVKEKKGEPQQEEISKLVTGACKYSLLKNTPIKDMTFDVEQSIDLEGDSGPYLQYTNVRALSILEKEAAPEKFDETLLKKDKEIKLLKTLSQFPEVVDKAAEGYKPNLICNYLFDLAQQFNTFYEDIPVLKAGEDTKKARLALVKATNQVLENGLYLLGINTPQQM